MKYIAFLRAVNVGSHNRITMKKLVEVLQKAGLRNVTTYIQSGNVLFSTDLENPDELIREALLKEFGLSIGVIVKTQEDLIAIVAKNPFPEETAHVTFLSELPTKEQVTALMTVDGKGDDFIVSGDIAYICSKGPYHKTVFGNAFFEKRLKIAATTRNYKTLATLSRQNQ